MNILFVYSLKDVPHPTAPVRDLKEIHLGISYISSLLKSRGHATELFVATGRTERHSFEETIGRFRPGIIGFTAVASEYEMISHLAQDVKRKHPEIYLLAGGSHVSLCPDEAIGEAFDAVCVGEGEYPTLELAGCLSGRRRPNRIPNLWIKEGTRIEKNPPRAFLPELDALPPPDRAMWEKWIGPSGKARQIVLLGRGCPYECAYCCNHALKRLAGGVYVRRRSGESIIQEVKDIINKYQETSEIYYEIETIGMDMPWAIAFCSKLEALNRGLARPVAYGVNLRITSRGDYQALFAALKKANFRYVAIGLESGSPRVREEVLGRNYSNGEIASTVRLAREHGLQIFLYVMVGMVGERRVDFKETIRLCRACRPDTISLSIFFPYPGTRLHQLCREKGLLPGKIDRRNERRRAVLDLPGFSRRQIQRAFRRFAYNVYRGYRPEYSPLRFYPRIIWSGLRARAGNLSRVLLPPGPKRGLLAMEAHDRAGLDNSFFDRLLLLASMARGRFLSAARGRRRRAGWERLLGREAPRFLLELGSGLVLMGAISFLASLLLRAWTGERRFRAPVGPGKVGYLRVHFFPVRFGGTLAHTKGVIEGFGQNGWARVILSSDRISGLEEDARLHVIPPGGFFQNLGEVKEAAYNLKLLWRGLRVLRRERPDFLYYRQTGFCFAPLALARILRLPLVLEFNSSDHWRARFWKERRYRFPGLLSKIERLNLKGADLVVTVSAVCREQIGKMGFRGEKRILVNPNGVNPERFHPEISGEEIRGRLHLRPQEVVAGFAGTFMVYHGVEILAGAIVELKGRKESEGWRFLFLGEGGSKERIRKFLEENGCAPAARFSGAVPFEEIPRYLAACDILVSPHHPPPADVPFFGSPVKIFEYMAMGKAIVASRVGQIADILTDGEDALLVPPGDRAALAGALLRLGKDRELRRRLGANARRKAAEHFTWRQNVRNVLLTLDRLAQDRRIPA